MWLIIRKPAPLLHRWQSDYAAKFVEFSLSVGEDIHEEVLTKRGVFQIGSLTSSEEYHDFPNEGRAEKAIKAMGLNNGDMVDQDGISYPGACWLYVVRYV